MRYPQAAGQAWPALQQLQLALQQTPATTGLVNNLGNTLQDLGVYAEALDCLQRAVDLDPEHLEALACLVRLKE